MYNSTNVLFLYHDSEFIWREIHNAPLEYSVDFCPHGLWALGVWRLFATYCFTIHMHTTRHACLEINKVLYQKWPMMGSNLIQLWHSSMSISAIVLNVVWIDSFSIGISIKSPGQIKKSMLWYTKDCHHHPLRISRTEMPRPQLKL